MRICRGRRFQADGAATEKKQFESWRLDRGTIESPRDVDQSRVSEHTYGPTGILCTRKIQLGFILDFCSLGLLLYFSFQQTFYQAPDNAGTCNYQTKLHIVNENDRTC